MSWPYLVLALPAGAALTVHLGGGDARSLALVALTITRDAVRGLPRTTASARRSGQGAPPGAVRQAADRASARTNASSAS